MNLNYYYNNTKEININKIDLNNNLFIFISDKKKIKIFDINIKQILEKNITDPSNSKFLFISNKDTFDKKDISEILSLAIEKNENYDISLLTPYITPPQNDFRLDGEIQSFLLNIKSIELNTLLKYNSEPSLLIFNIVYKYLNSNHSKNLKVFQIGKQQQSANKRHEELNKTLSNSMILIPHKGKMGLLNRLLLHLNGTKKIPSEIRICFDDNSYKNFSPLSYDKLTNRLKWTSNRPLNCGPYLGRHHSILSTNKKYIFFQDSDDISTIDRFERQLEEMNLRNLDIIGSHELRVDELSKRLFLIRFPLDVNDAFKYNPAHPLFHPTSMITKKGYLKTKGFSTNLKFGYDLQLTYRASFYLKMGNIDEFLYIRFKRKGSLTTHPKTKIGSNLRTFLSWRWKVEYQLVKDGKLNLDDSSLALQKHLFKYKMIQQS